MDPLFAWLAGLGRKGQLLLVTLLTLVAVALADKAAAVEIGWCVVAAYATFSGANSAITIGRKGPPKTSEHESA